MIKNLRSSFKLMGSLALFLALAARCAEGTGSSRGVGAIADAGPVAHDAATTGSDSDPKALRPVSAKHQGTLSQVDDLADVIAGNTVVIVQPWVGLNKYELRENPIYFREDGYADSAAFIDIPWMIKGSDLCVAGGGVDRCYSAFSDDEGQAYLMEKNSRLLAKVSTIDSGDAHHVRQMYEERKKAEAAQAQMMMAFAGLLFEAMTTPDYVVCEQGIFGTTCYD